MQALMLGVRAIGRELRQRGTDWLLAHRIRARHPTMTCHPTARWDYAYRDIDRIRIGERVFVGSFAEILVYRKAKFSNVEGSFSIGDGSVITTGVNIRAAGGAISIGAGTGIGQNCIIVAANHAVIPGEPRFYTPWDEERCGVEIGNNVWVGALCVIVPGASIGDDAVIAAGSVVTGAVPAGELWGGSPARKIRDIEAGAGHGAALRAARESL